MAQEDHDGNGRMIRCRQSLKSSRNSVRSARMTARESAFEAKMTGYQDQ